MKPLDFDLLGCPVSDYATGKMLGRVKCVVRDHPQDGVARIAVECAPEPEASEPDDLCFLDVSLAEPRPHSDYMVGQIATVTLSDPTGTRIIASGEAITPQVLDHARRAGLLHRLEATFAQEAG